LLQAPERRRWATYPSGPLQVSPVQKKLEEEEEEEEEEETAQRKGKGSAQYYR
jgi:hypothetical protein